MEKFSQGGNIWDTGGRHVC